MKLNDTKFGFTLVSIDEIKDINATLYQYRHKKSGGLVVYLANEDTNCGGAFGFRTTPEDSTGVCHIIEHSLLCGSEKYPLKEPFVNLLKSSLNTFLNAFTAYDWTMYPFASQVPKDFDNILSIYADAVFNPLSMKDKKPFLQEGWHLELNEIDGTPSYKGVVYNEMKGAMSDVEEVLTQSTLEAMYKDSFYRFNSGGDPDVIPTLTYEAYKDFYKRHYTPQNAMTFFYGKLDIESKLKFLNDEYFCNYKKTFDEIKIMPQLPFINLNYEKEYEIGKDEDEKDNTYISLCYGLDHYQNQEDLLAMEIIFEALLSSNDSPVKKALLDAKLGQDVTCRIDDDNIIPALHIYLHKTNPNCKERFKQVFEKTISDIANEGIDRKLLLAAINHNEFKAKEMDLGKTPKGIIYAMTLMQSFNYNCSFVDALEYSKYFNKFRSKLNGIYFENLLNKFIINSTHMVECVLIPSKTLGETKKAEMDKKMAELKETLSSYDKALLLKQTKDLIRYQSREDSKKELATLPKLAIKDIPKQINFLDSKKIKAGGVGGISHELDTNKIGYLRFYFSLKRVYFEDLPYVLLLKCLLLNSPTTKYSVTDLRTEIKTYLGDFAINEIVTPCENNKDGFNFYLRVSTSALFDNISHIPDLVKQVLLHSKFSRVEALRIVKQLANSCRQDIIGNGMSLAMNEARAAFSKSSAITAKGLSGVSLYSFFNDLANNFDFNLVNNKLKDLIRVIFTRNNTFYSISGDKETLVELKSIVRCIRFPQKLYINYLDVTLNEKESNALVIPSGVSYNSICGSYKDAGYSYDGKYAVISHIIRYDYLWPEVRVKGGAYGCTISFNRVDGTLTLGSFRDPNVKDTYSIYKNLPNYLANFKANRSQFTSYIIGAMGGFDMPGSNSSLINEWDFNYINGITKKDKMRIKREILNAKVSDVNKASELFAKVFDSVSEYTIGNEDKVKEYNFNNVTTLQ